MSIRDALNRIDNQDVRDVVMYGGAFGFPVMTIGGPDASGLWWVDFELSPSANVKDFCQCLYEWQMHFEMVFDDYLRVSISPDSTDKARAFKTLNDACRAYCDSKGTKYEGFDFQPTPERTQLRIFCDRGGVKEGPIHASHVVFISEL